MCKNWDPLTSNRPTRAKTTFQPHTLSLNNLPSL